MNESRELRRVFPWSAGTIAPIAAAALLGISRVNEATAGLVFLAMVVWFAAYGGVRLSLYVAFLCAVLFDYFFIPPVRTMQLAGPQEWLEMLSFLVCSLVVGRLAERARRHTLQAEHRREDVERLNELSQEMMLHENTAGLIRDLPHLVNRIFALDGVALFIKDQDQYLCSGSDFPMSAEASLRAVMAGANPAFSITAGLAAMPLTMGLRPIGALGWRPPERLSREVATAAGAQVAAALLRSVAIESSARLEAFREGERLRAALIDSLTHELRTPLTSIRAAATTLLEGEGLDEEARRDLAALVDEESSRLDALIGEAVEMAEIDAHVVKVQLVRQSPRTLFEHVLEQSRAALADHRVSIDAQDAEQPAWFDPHLLGRVFRHLLENAARYSSPATPIVLGSRRNFDRLEFSVADGGPGIDPADMPLIFEKFYRGRQGSTIGKGTGMGLAIARAIMQAHGGGIEADSARGKGTTFRFWVPLIEGDPLSQIEAE